MPKNAIWGPEGSRPKKFFESGLEQTTRREESREEEGHPQQYWIAP